MLTFYIYCLVIMILNSTFFFKEYGKEKNSSFSKNLNAIYWEPKTNLSCITHPCIPENNVFSISPIFLNFVKCDKEYYVIINPDISRDANRLG